MELNSEFLLSQCLKPQSIVYWEKDLSSIYTYVNSLFCKTFSFTDKDGNVIGKTDYDIPTPALSLADLFRQGDQEVLINKNSLRFLETFKDKNNEWCMLLTTKSPLSNQEGEIIGTTGYAIDITVPFFQMGHILINMRSKRNSFSFNPTKIFTIIQKKQKVKNLTPKQLEVLFFLLRHKTAKEIAQFLNVSYRSVEDRIERIKEKLNCTTRSEIFDTALEKGLYNFIPDSLLHNQSCVFLGEVV